MSWKNLESITTLQSIVSDSDAKPVLIFKHSTRCPISSMAKSRIEGDWKVLENQVDWYFLDLIQHRDISNAIADKFKVHHESPQLLLIQNGTCTFNASHLDITVPEIQAVLV